MNSHCPDRIADICLKSSTRSAWHISYDLEKKILFQGDMCRLTWMMNDDDYFLRSPRVQSDVDSAVLDLERFNNWQHYIVWWIFAGKSPVDLYSLNSVCCVSLSSTPHLLLYFSAREELKNAAMSWAGYNILSNEQSICNCLPWLIWWFSISKFSIWCHSNFFSVKWGYMVASVVAAPETL
jgi:hypothetical protein